MKKLLVLCPSRGRPFMLMSFIKNFRETTNENHTELMILLDKDDSDLGVYLEKMPPDIKYQVYDRSSDWTLTTEIINRAFEENKNYEFYSVTNDDMEYITKGWDEKLSVKGKLSCGKEINSFKKFGWIKKHSLTHKGGFPYTSVIDGDLVRDVRWLQFPGGKCSTGDCAWYSLTMKLKVFNPIAEIEYRHKSHYWGDGEYDETASRTDAAKHMDTDHVVYRRWKNHKMMDLVKRIKGEQS